MNTLLSIKNLTVTVGATKILDDVSLEVGRGKIVGIVGGSGSGKTTLGLSILRLLPTAMHTNSGEIIFDGQNIALNSDGQMRALRGAQVGMVFQEPLSAFDPLFTIGFQMDETLCAHTGLSASARRGQVLDILRSVEISDPERIYKSYPHQLSGGLRQRAMIAQAICCKPSLIIADEPTSSLDVTIQAKVMQLLRKLNGEHQMTILLIAHDLGMVGHLSDEVAVMAEGKIVEYGRSSEILINPKHVYTKTLVEAYQ